MKRELYPELPKFDWYGNGWTPEGEQERYARMNRTREGRPLTDEDKFRNDLDTKEYQFRLKEQEKYNSQTFEPDNASYNRGFFEDLVSGVKAAAKDIGLRRGGRIRKVGLLL